MPPDRTVRVVTIAVDELRAIVEAAAEVGARRALDGRDPGDDWLDQTRAADMLGVKRSSVPTLCTRDGLPHSRVGRLYRFRRAEIDAWLKARARKPQRG